MDMAAVSGAVCPGLKAASDLRYPVKAVHYGGASLLPRENVWDIGHDVNR